MVKKAIVSGASRGIGKALTLALAARGVHVWGIGRNQKALSQVKESAPDLFNPVVADLTDIESLSVMVEDLKPIGGVDYLIHNAATVLPLMPLSQVSWQDWDRAFRVNLGTPVILTQQLLGNLNGKAKVLFVNSGAAFHAIPGALTYCATKAALNMVCRGWQAEHPEIAFAQVCPGMVDTDMQAQMRSASPSMFPAVETFCQVYAQNGLISSELAASFMRWLLMDLKQQDFSGTIWDIDDADHRRRWQNETQ